MKAIRTIYQCVICGGEVEVRELEDGRSTSAAACSLSGRESDYRLVLLVGEWMLGRRVDDGRVDWRFLDNRANWSLEVEARPWCDDCKRAVQEALLSRRESLVLSRAPQMTCDFDGLRRNLAAAYNRHVDELVEANADEELRESCREIGNGIAALLALSSDEGIADLSDAVTLHTPFGED